jgi:hypothetical protein
VIAKQFSRRYGRKLKPNAAQRERMRLGAQLKGGAPRWWGDTRDLFRKPSIPGLPKELMPLMDPAERRYMVRPSNWSWVAMRGLLARMTGALFGRQRPDRSLPVVGVPEAGASGLRNAPAAAPGAE